MIPQPSWGGVPPWLIVNLGTRGLLFTTSIKCQQIFERLVVAQSCEHGTPVSASEQGMFDRQLCG